MAVTIAMIKNINQMEIVYTFKESDFFCTISVGKNCRDGSNTLLLTDQQEYQHLGLVVMIESQDIFKIMDFILIPLQIIVFFTEYSSFTDYSSRFQIIVSLKCRPSGIRFDVKGTTIFSKSADNIGFQKLIYNTVGNGCNIEC